MRHIGDINDKEVRALQDLKWFINIRVKEEGFYLISINTTLWYTSKSPKISKYFIENLLVTIIKRP